MLSGHMLPIHFPPAPDELFSSWYVRLAHANHLKAETFGTILWGRQRQIWNRDIDRLSPEWLVKELADRTGTPAKVAWETTLKSYEGKLFPELRQTGISPWLLPVQIYHRTHKWPGIQYCPECLKEDNEPYFRKRWRLALYTVCTRHGAQMCNRCINCNEPVMYHRRELGKGSSLDLQPLSLCYKCDHDLCSVMAPKAVSYEQSASVIAADAIGWLEQAQPISKDVGFYVVLHQICKLLTSEKWGRNLLSSAADQLGLDIRIDRKGKPDSVARTFFEHRTIDERNQILHIAYWFLADPATRLRKVLETKRVRFNRLYRDLHSIPTWYQTIILGFPHRSMPKFG